MLKLVERDLPKSKRFTSEIVMVSPQVARAWLDKKIKNRTIANGTVHGYARNMKAGKWRLTGDAIRFDKDGNLIDGEHRLLACIAADTPFETLVIYGLDPVVRDQMDTGRARRFNDVLTMREVNNANLTAATIRVMFGQKYNDPMRFNRMTHAEASDLLAKHPKLHVSVRRVNQALGPPKSLLAYIHYVAYFKLDQPSRAEAFIEVFKSGQPDYLGDPAHKLRERMLRSGMAREAIKREEVLKAVFYAWNLFSKKKKVDNFKWPKDVTIEGFDPSKL